MKNRIKIITATLMTLCILAGCGTVTADITAAEVWAAIEDVAPPEKLPVMMDIDAAALKTYYGLGTDEVVDFYGKMPLLNVTATEILVVHAQKKQVEAVNQALKARLYTVYNQWIDSEQAELVSDCLIIENGDWLLLVVAESAEDIMNAFSMCTNSYKR